MFQRKAANGKGGKGGWLWLLALPLLLGQPLSLPVADHDGDDGEVDGLIVVDGADGAVDNEEMATITGAPPT